MSNVLSISVNGYNTVSYSNRLGECLGNYCWSVLKGAHL